MLAATQLTADGVFDAQEADAQRAQAKTKLDKAKVDFYEQQTTPGPVAAPGLTPGTGLGDAQGLRSEMPSSVGSGRGTVSLPRNISHGGGANTGHLQNAIQARQQAVLSASRAHTLSYR
jgi:hypothetical protein